MGYRPAWLTHQGTRVNARISFLASGKSQVVFLTQWEARTNFRNFFWQAIDDCILRGWMSSLWWLNCAIYESIKQMDILLLMYWYRITFNEINKTDNNFFFLLEKLSKDYTLITKNSGSFSKTIQNVLIDGTVHSSITRFQTRFGEDSFLKVATCVKYISRISTV